MDILTIKNVSKHFGSKQVVKDLSFSIPENTVYGFIGKNGAGKTTTMKMILGLMKMDEGEIYVNGNKVTFGQNITNKDIGYLPDVPEYYGYMTPREYLRLCGQITDMPKKEINERVEELLTLVGLSNEKKRIKGFSRGMKQRLGIAQALLHSPKLLICDEPTSALDPVGRKEILEILSRVKDKTTVIFSTHILSDVERICDRIAFLNAGSIVLEGSLEEIRKRRKSNRIEVECCSKNDADKLLKKLANGERPGENVVICAETADMSMKQLLKVIADEDIAVQRVESMEPSLEDLFVEVVKG